MNIDLQITQEFKTNIKCVLPGEGTDSYRDFNFDATFELVESDEWEEILRDSTKSEAVARVLKKVDEEKIKPVTVVIDDKEVTYSPVEVVCKNAMTCDAAFMHYNLYINRNSRDKAMQAAESKNSKRSRKR